MAERAIESAQQENRLFPPTEAFAKGELDFLPPADTTSSIASRSISRTPIGPGWLPSSIGSRSGTSLGVEAALREMVFGRQDQCGF